MNNTVCKITEVVEPIHLVTFPFDASSPSPATGSQGSTSGAEADYKHHCKDEGNLLVRFLEAMGTEKTVAPAYRSPCSHVCVENACLTSSRPLRPSDWQVIPEWKPKPCLSEKVDHRARPWLTAWSELRTPLFGMRAS